MLKFAIAAVAACFLMLGAPVAGGSAAAAFAGEPFVGGLPAPADLGATAPAAEPEHLRGIVSLERGAPDLSLPGQPAELASGGLPAVPDIMSTPVSFEGDAVPAAGEPFSALPGSWPPEGR